MAGGNLATLNVKLTADSSSYSATFRAASDALNEFSKKQHEYLADIAKDLAAAFTIDKLVEFGAQAIESAASLNLLSQSSGVAVEELSSLKLAAAASGLGTDALAEGLKHLNTSLAQAAGDSTSKAGEAFRALGVGVTNTNGSLKNAAQILPEIADKFKAMADGPIKTAIAVDLLGKAGENMIPVLNLGAAGLAKFKQEAQDAGLVISGELAAAADDFSTRMTILKATIVDGLAVQLAAKLLPVLNELADQFEKGGSAGSKLAAAADLIVTGVKYVAVGVIETVGAFQRLGTAIGAIGAAAVQFATGNFSEAGEIIKQSTADIVKNRADTEAQTLAIMQAGSADELALISTTESEKRRIKNPGTNPALLKAGDEGLKQLTDYDAGLRAQAASFGLGAAAAANYKLQFGPLADALKKVAAAGGDVSKIVADIKRDSGALAFAEAKKKSDDLSKSLVEQIATYNDGDLEAFKFSITTGELGQAFKNMGEKGKEAQASLIALKSVQISEKDATIIQGINIELEQMAGNLSKAAVDGFNLQNALLIKNVGATGSDSDKAALAAKLQATAAQASYNEQVQKGADAELAYASTEATVNAQVANGQLTTLQGQALLEAARQTQIASLTQVYNAEKAIADQNAVTMPQLTKSTQALQNQLTSLGSQTNLLAKQINDDFKSAFADNLLSAETGAKSLTQAIHDMATSIEKDLLTIANKNIAESIFGTGSGGGGAAGGLASLFGGGGLSGLFGGGGSSIASTGAAAAGTDTGALADTIMPTFADGGTLGAGKMGIVGERGIEVAYSGAKDMHIIPNHALGGKNLNVTNHFTVQSQNGTIARQSQMQMAAEAARQISMASRRNN
jgi:flagellar biosynthesis chaperone FliJ